MNRLITIIKLIIISVLIMFSGSVVWNVAARYNISQSPNFPWSVAVGFLSITLWIMFFKGKIISRHAEFRAAYSNINVLKGQELIKAVTIGLLFSVTMISVLLISMRIITIKFGMYPLGEVSYFNKLLYLFMIALVAAVTEEVAFRGYLQSRLREWVGWRSNLIICSVIFSLVHVAHPEFIFILPVYFFYSYYLGIITKYFNSIIPAIVIHTLTDFTIFMLFLHVGANDLSRQLSVTGIDGNFIFLVVLGLSGAWLGILSLRHLQTRRKS